MLSNVFPPPLFACLSVGLITTSYSHQPLRSHSYIPLPSPHLPLKPSIWFSKWPSSGRSQATGEPFHTNTPWVWRRVQSKPSWKSARRVKTPGQNPPSSSLLQWWKRRPEWKSSPLYPKFQWEIQSHKHPCLDTGGGGHRGQFCLQSTWCRMEDAEGCGQCLKWISWLAGCSVAVQNKAALRLRLLKSCVHSVAISIFVICVCLESPGVSGLGPAQGGGTLLLCRHFPAVFDFYITWVSTFQVFKHTDTYSAQSLGWSCPWELPYLPF